MRRRRIRIQRRHEEEQPPKLRVPAATLQSAEPATSLSLRPEQARLLDIQQSAGNQSALRVMRTLVQRANAQGKDEQDEENTLNEVVDTGGGLSGINDITDTHSLLSAAITAYKDEKYGTALIAFREMYRQQPNPGALVNMAICELRLDLFPEAQDDLSEALKSQELSAMDFKRATAALDSVRKLESSGSVGFMELPHNVNTDNATVAKEPRALRNQLRTIYQSAESAAKSEDYEAALKAFRLANRRLPHPVTLLNIGKCLVMLQRYSEAETAFSQALRDRQLTGGPRKATEAELELAKRFQGQSLDDMGDLPPET